MTTQPNGPRHDGPKCGARGRQSGQPCQLPAGWGTAHVGAGNCRKHLGNAPGQIIAARRQLAEDAAEQFGVPLECSADEALLNELAISAGQVRFIRSRLAVLSPDQMTSGWERVTQRQRANPNGPGVVIEETTVAKSTPNVWWALLEVAQKYHAHVAATVAQLRIEDRRIKRAEELGTAFYEALLLTMQQAGLDPQQQAAILQGIPAAVRTVTGEVIDG